MNSPANDYGLSPDEIMDGKFRHEDNTATTFEGEVWWLWDQFLAVHCQHVGQSVRRLGAIESTIERQSGDGVVGEMEMPDGRWMTCLPRWAALRYLNHRRHISAAVLKHRNGRFANE